MKQPTILITGVTGFIGGSLAAAWLARGARIIALARGVDPTTRARDQVTRCATGFGLTLKPSDWERFQVLPYDLEVLAKDTSWHTIDAVWHAAAWMSFSMKKLRDAFDTNVGGTRALYELVAKYAQKRPRFYYVSTAYTGGVDAKEIREELHLSPHVINPYFASKWSTELVLEKLSRDLLPVTLFRPSIVVGHTQTGWYGGQSFGFYNFIDGFHLGRQAGTRHIHLNIAPDTLHNYIPIDDLVANALALTDREDQQKSFEIVHEIGTENPNHERVKYIAEGLGLSFSFGRPKSLGDHLTDLWVEVNKPFNRTEVGIRPFPFVGGRLQELVGANYSYHVLDESIHRHLVAWYLEHRLLDVQKKSEGAMRMAKLAQKTGLFHLNPKMSAGAVAKQVAGFYLGQS